MSYPPQPQHANPYQQQQWTPPTQRRPKSSSKVHWFAYPVVAVVFLVIGVAAGGAGNNSSDDTATTAAARTGAENTTAAVKDKEKKKPVKAAPAAVTIPGDGTFEVPGDVKPGTYVTKGGEGCYWAREKDTSGDFESIIANGNPTGQTTVTIKKSDGAFETQMCKKWTRKH